MKTDLIEAYAQHLHALNRAPRTVAAHLRRLEVFFTFAEVQDVNDITTSIVLDYQKHLSNQLNQHGRLNTVAVQNQHLSVVAGFFRHLQQAGYVAHDPTRDLEYARVPQQLPKAVLTIKEVNRLLKQPNVNTVLGYRDRTILEILYSTGIRRQELLNLTLEDMNLEDGFLMIRQGKGSKDRVVPLGNIAARYLETYINGLRPELAKRGASKTEALILSSRGRVMGRNTLGEMVEKYARRAGLKQGVSPHTFRHTCATHMIRNRANIRHVQEMLGHANLNSTQKYLHLTITDLKESHQKYHPREKNP